MAQFRAVIQGQRGEASRLGSKKSGLQVQCNGWNMGVSVQLDHVKEMGRERDLLTLHITRGSNNTSSVARLQINEDMLDDAGFIGKLQEAFNLVTAGVK